MNHLLKATFYCLIGLCSPAYAISIDFTQIAVTGDAAPDVDDGAQLSSFAAPSLNNAGGVAFLASLRTGTGPAVDADSNTAIFQSGSAGSALGLAMREGPLVGDIQFNEFRSPSFNDSGDVAFEAALRTSVNFTFNDALFGPTSGAGSTLGLIAQDQDPAPGVTGGAFGLFSRPSLNQLGQIAFDAALAGGSNRNAIFGPTSGAGTTLGLIVREDDSAPGVTDGAEFSDFRDPSINATGNIAFRAFLRTGTGPAVFSGNNEAIFGPASGASSTFSLIAREDTPAPGVSDGAEFSAFGDPSINATGDVAFNASLRTGTGPAVAPEDSFAIFGPEAGASSTLGLIARSGAPAPGVSDNALFSAFGLPSLNDSGNVGFFANLRTGIGASVTPENDRALFARIDGDLQLIVREGDLFDTIDPSTGLPEQRTISLITFDSEGLNNADTLAFGLIFTDGTSGIFTASITPVPEPTALTLAALVTPALLRRRRVAKT